MSNDDKNPNNTNVRKAEFGKDGLLAVHSDRNFSANEGIKVEDPDGENVLILEKTQRSKAPRRSNGYQALKWGGILGSLAWFYGVSSYVTSSLGWENILTFLPHELGGFLAGALAPVALFWMVLAFVMRSRDVEMYAEALRSELQSMIFPSEAAERRVNNDIQRLIRQTAEMSRATKIAMDGIDEARKALSEEMGRLQDFSSDTKGDIQNVLQQITERIGAFRSLVIDLKSSNQDIDQATEKGVKYWQDAAEHLKQELEYLENSFDKELEKINAVIERANTQVTDVETRLGQSTAAIEVSVDENLNRMLSQFERFDGYISQLNQTSEDTDRSIEQMSLSIRDNIDNLLGLNSQLASTAAETSGQLREERLGLLEDAEVAANTVENKIRGLIDVVQSAHTEAQQTIATAGEVFEGEKAELIHQAEVAAQQVMDALSETISDMKRVNIEQLDTVQEARTMLEDQRQSLVDDADYAAERARNVAESLQAGTDRLYEFTDDAMDKAKVIETRIGAQLNQVQIALSNIQATVGEFETVSSLSADKINQSNAQTISTIEELETRLGSGHETVDALTQRVETSIQNLDMAIQDRLHNTADTYNSIEEQMQFILAAYEGNNAKLSHHHQNGFALLETMRNEMQDLHQSIEFQTAQSQKQIDALKDSLVEPFKDIRDLSGEASDNTEFVRETLQTVTKALQSVNMDMTQRAQHIEQSLSDQSERIAVLAGRISADSSDINDTFVKRANDLEGRVQKALLSLHKVSDAIGIESNKLEDKASESSHILSGFAERIASARDTLNKETYGSKTILEEQLNYLSDKTNYIASQSQVTLKRLGELNSSMDKEASVITDNTAQALAAYEEAIKGIQTSRKAFGNEMSQYKIDAQSVLEHQKSLLDDLMAETQKSIALLDERESAVLSTHHRLEASNDSALEKFDGLRNELSLIMSTLKDKSRDISEALDQTFDHIKSQTDKMDKNFTESVETIRETEVFLSDTAEAIRTSLNTVVTEFNASGEHALEQAEALSEHSKRFTNDIYNLEDSVTEQIEKLKSSDTVLDHFHQRTQSTFNNLSDTIEERTRAIAEEWSLISNEMKESFFEREEDVMKSLGKIKTWVGDLYSSFGSLDENITTKFDGNIKYSQDRMSELRTTIERTVQENENNIKEIFDRIDKTSLEARQRWTYVLTSAQNGIEEIMVNLREDIEMLQSNSSQTIDNTQEALSDVTEALQGRIDDIRASVNQLTDAGRENVEDALTYVEQTLEKVDLSMQNISDKAQASGDKVQSSVVALLEAEQSISSSTDQLFSSIRELQERSGETAESIVRKERTVSDDLQRTLSNLEQGLHTLRAEADRASKKTVEAANRDSRLQRDYFLNSTKFVVESLHSLSLDFTRMLEGEVHEKTWKAYQKGESGAFTKRLLSLRSDESANHIRRKYKEDVEFRTYVQRYLRQFEEVYDQAQQNDHGGLLTSVFLSSDIGRLYTYLSTILERAQRRSTEKKDNTTRAA